MGKSKKKQGKRSARDNPATTKSANATRRPRLSPAVRFVLFFVLALVVLGGAYSFLTARYHDHLEWFLEFTAASSGALASLVSSHVEYEGRYIMYRGFSVEIIDECTGLLEMVIFLAAVLAFSTTWRNKLLGMVLGIPAIYLFNIARIEALLLSGASSKELFDFMHLYFWQATLIIMIATVWIAWLYLVVFREKKTTVAVSG